MIVDRIELTKALLLLLFPLGLILGKKLNLRTYNQISDDGSHWMLAWIRVPILWVDPIRAFLGTWFLTESMMPSKGGSPQMPFLTAMGVLAAAQLIQIFSVRKAEIMLAPLLFLSGMLLALNDHLQNQRLTVPPAVAPFAIILAVAGATAMRTWMAFFAIAAVAVMAFGYLFQGQNLWLAGTAGLMMEGFLIGFISSRDYVMPTR